MWPMLKRRGNVLTSTIPEQAAAAKVAAAPAKEASAAKRSGGAAKGEKKEKKKTRHRTYHLYIRQMLASAFPTKGVRISHRAMLSVNALADNMVELLAQSMHEFARASKQETLNERGAQSAVKVFVADGSIYKRIHGMADSAVRNYKSAGSGTKDKRKPASERAGLWLSVPHTLSLIRKALNKPRVGMTAAVYVTAAIEGLLMELLDQAILGMRAHNRETVTNAFLNRALHGDKLLPGNSKSLRDGEVELLKTFENFFGPNFSFADGGVTGGVETALLSKEQKKAEKKKEAAADGKHTKKKKHHRKSSSKACKR